MYRTGNRYTGFDYQVVNNYLFPFYPFVPSLEESISMGLKTKPLLSKNRVLMQLGGVVVWHSGRALTFTWNYEWHMQSHWDVWAFSFFLSVFVFVGFLWRQAGLAWVIPRPIVILVSQVLWLQEWTSVPSSLLLVAFLLLCPDSRTKVTYRGKSY